MGKAPLVGMVSGVLCWLLYPAGLEACQPPNVVLIFSDDQGMNDVGCYGSEIPTPHIDSIAQAGVKFENWYVAAPVCTPSRFALLTGQYPNRSRDQLMGALMFLWDRDADRGIRAGETTIAQVLRNRGYRTALIGKWHLGHGKSHFLPTRHGFDWFYGLTGGGINYFTLKYGIKPDWYRGEKLVDEQGYATDLLSREAVRFLQEQKPDKPFFLYLAYNAPHFGKGWDPDGKKVTNILQPQENYLQKFKGIEDPKRRAFAAMVAAMDDGIGRVLEAINKRGLQENTLVIFTCDNGADPRYGGSNLPLRGRKAMLFEGGIRVPCLMRWPGRIRPGTTTSQVGSTMDLFPTLCHLAGADPAGKVLDGIDLTAALLEGRKVDRALLWQNGGNLAFRQGPWKYLKQAEGGELLFNLGNDASEKINLAQEYPERLAELKASHAAIAATFARK